MIVEIKPKTKDLSPWQGESVENSVMQPTRIRAKLGGDLRYKVALDEKRLAELSKTTGYDLSLNGDPDTPHPFWDTNKVARVTLENQTNVFDTTNPVDEIRVAIAKANDWVAKDLEDADNRPETKFVVFSEEEDSQRKAKRVHSVTEATIIANKLSKTDKMRLLKILTGNYHTNASNEGIDVAIFDLVQHQPTEFSRWAKTDKTKLALRTMILNALDEGFLQRHNGRIMFGDVQLGIDLDEAVTALETPDLTEIRARLKEKLDTAGY